MFVCLMHTGKLVVVVGPQYLRAARSYALAAFSSLSYPPKTNNLKLLKLAHFNQHYEL